MSVLYKTKSASIRGTDFNPIHNSAINSLSSLNYISEQPVDTFRVNPLCLHSLKNLDVDKLEDDLAKGIQRKRVTEARERLEILKLFEENEDIKEIKNRVRLAQLNQERSKQIYEKQTRRMQDIVKDAEMDEKVLSKLEEDRLKNAEIEEKKKLDKLQSKSVLQMQMKEKEKLKEESKQEYLRDKQLVDDIVQRILKENQDQINEDRRKKAIARGYMNEAYEDRSKRKQKQKEEERFQKENERKYFEDVAKREMEQRMKKAAIQEEKDKIFDKLCADEEKRRLEKDYWENVRNELHVEEMNRKAKIQELEEKEKKQRQKEEMLQWAIEQLQVKESRKKEEENLESEFKKKLLEKYAEDERVEQCNYLRRRQREIDLKNEIERQWKLKLVQYQQQKAQEMEELEQAKAEEVQKREIIEKEKLRLIKENEDLLKTYFTKGYYKSLSNMTAQ